MKNKLKLIIGITFVVFLAAWFSINPSKQFGPSCYAFTIFNKMPLPLIDIQIRWDGTFRRVQKTHALNLSDIQWLIDDNPEALIISLGWAGIVDSRDVSRLKMPQIHLLQNELAIQLFNRLKREGKRVSIHYHSTC